MPSIAWLAACNQVFPLARLSNLNGWNYPPTPWPGRHLGPPLVLACPDCFHCLIAFRLPSLQPLRGTTSIVPLRNCRTHPALGPPNAPNAPRQHLFCTALKLPDTPLGPPNAPNAPRQRVWPWYRLQLAIQWCIPHACIHGYAYIYILHICIYIHVHTCKSIISYRTSYHLYRPHLPNSRS